MPPFRVEIGESLKLINNSPPTFVISLGLITLEAGQSKSYSPGSIKDYENNDAYVSSVSGFSEYSWVKFTNSSSVDSVVFDFDPPKDLEEEL